MGKHKKDVISQDNPYLKLLLMRIEEECGFKEGMTGKIEHLKEYTGLSRNNVRKIWGIDPDKSHILNLDLLVQKAKIDGIDTWNQYIANYPDLEFLGGDQLNDAEKLKIGDQVTYGIFPFRYITFEYLGDCVFKICKHIGGKQNKTGDKIDARWFEVSPQIIGPTLEDVEQTGKLTVVGVLGKQRTKIEL